MIEDYLSNQGLVWYSNKSIKKLNGILVGSQVINGEHSYIVKCGLKKEITFLNCNAYSNLRVDIEKKVEIPLGYDGINYVHWKNIMVYEPLKNLIKIRNIKKYKDFEDVLGFQGKVSKTNLEMIKNQKFSGRILYKKKYSGLFMNIFGLIYFLPKKQNIGYFWKGIWSSDYRKFNLNLYKLIRATKNLSKLLLLEVNRENKENIRQRNIKIVSKKINVLMIFMKCYLMYLYQTYETYTSRKFKKFFKGGYYNYLLKRINFYNFLKGLFKEFEKGNVLLKDIDLLNTARRKEILCYNIILDSLRLQNNKEVILKEKISNRVFVKFMVLLLEKGITKEIIEENKVKYERLLEKEDTIKDNTLNVEIINYPRKYYFKPVVKRVSKEDLILVRGGLKKIKKKKINKKK